jgi:protein-tyrosine-phosphatase
VSERRSSADARDVYYHLDLEQMRALYLASGSAIHPMLTAAAAPPARPQGAPPARVIFLCTHNSARSQMAEGLMRHLGGERVAVLSAGTQPASVHPDAIAALAQIGIDITAQQSKHLDQFRDQAFDYAITVCDQVREQCPALPGHPDTIHWSFPDPARITHPLERSRAFQTIAEQLGTRIRFLLTLIDRGQQGHQ